MDRIKFYLDTASGGMYVDYHLFRKVLKAIHDQFDELSSNSGSSSTTTTEFDTTELENRISTNETNIATLQTRADSEFITNASYDEENNQIIFTVANGTTVCTIDCTNFITSATSNILETAELVVNPDGQDEGTYIHLVFKTDEDTDDIYINVTSLIDIYTGSDSITVSDDNEISVNDDYIKELITNNVTTTSVSYDTAYDDGQEVGVLNVNGTETGVIVPHAAKDDYGVAMISDGLSVSDGIVAVQISDSSEAYLTVDKNGLAITGIDDIENRVTQAEANIETLETQIATVNTDTITTVTSGDDYIAVADDGSYNYTITANLTRITEDEITTLWEAI